MDVESGAIHVVDEIVYDLMHALDAMENVSDFRKVSDGKIRAASFDEIGDYLSFMLSSYDDGLIRESYEEVKELIEAGTLFSDDIYMEAADSFKNRESVVKALCLHVAHDCNLKCAYCFAGKGEYHGERELMSFEVGKKALDFLVRSSGSRVNLEVDFFGGEPLMNFDVVKRLVEYGRSIEKENNKKFRFTLTTNGVLLNDEILDFANKEMGNLVLSLDGRKEVHDRMRKKAGGQGSYDEIVTKFINAANLRGQMNYYVRGTYTRYNTDFAKDVIHMADLGFKQISVEPVVAKKSEDYALREEDIDILLSQYDELLDEMVRRKKEGRGFNFFHFMIDLSGGPCVYKRLSGCGSGTEYLAVSPSGDLYPCHQFVGMDEFLLGNVETGITNTEITDKFRLCNVYSKEKCKTCFAKFYCSGGCAANSYNFSGDINGTYEMGCSLQKKRIECAITLKALEMDD